MRLVLALSLSGLAAVLSAAEQPPALPTPNYYPLIKGTRWEYRVSDEETEIAVTCEVKEVEKKDGRTHARVEATFPNAVSLGEELSHDAEGVYRDAYVGVKLSQPFPIIKYPVKPADQWKQKVKLGDLEGTASISIRNTRAAVDVPAGKFTCLAVESVVESRGDKVAATIWYADGIGIVKQETTSGGRTMRMELKSFSPAR